MVRFGFRFIRVSIIAVCIAAIGSMPLAAQTGSLHLEGIVWDPSGNPLSGVSVVAVEETTERRVETVSDSDGYTV